MNLKTLLLTAWIGVLIFYFCIPAQAQWSIAGDTLHWKYTEGTSGADVSFSIVFGSADMYIEKVDPTEGGSVTATYPWLVTWAGTNPPPQKVVKCDLTAHGNARTHDLPNTATGSSNVDGDGGAIFLNYPPTLSKSVTYSVTVTSTKTLTETVALVLSGVFTGEAFGSVNMHF